MKIVILVIMFVLAGVISMAESETKKAVLVIDVQNDYFPNGKMELKDSIKAGEKTAELLKAARDKNIEVIYIQHISAREGAGFFIKGTEGAEIHKSVTPMKKEKIFQKNYPNSFRDTGLYEYLKSKNIGNLIVCGMMTQMCVDTTVRAGFDLGFKITLAADCCATKDLNYGGKTVSAENVQTAYFGAINGIFAKVVNSNEIEF